MKCSSRFWLNSSQGGNKIEIFTGIYWGSCLGLVSSMHSLKNQLKSLGDLGFQLLRKFPELTFSGTDVSGRDQQGTHNQERYYRSQQREKSSDASSFLKLGLLALDYT